jgi:CRISPR-associated endonuclease Csn1
LQKTILKVNINGFTDIEPKVGFKNSQHQIQGIITKYANAYLKSYFGRVGIGKGGMVYLEKLGGSRKAILKTGRNIMKSKTVAAYATLSCIDAITIVCKD